MNAIEATRRQVRELVDGTLEVKLHVEPRFKAHFHSLFPDIDMPVAIAPLLPGFEQPSAEADAKIIEAALFDRKGGALARLAGQFCAAPSFQAWLFDCDAIPEPTEEAAATWLRETCGVSSRAELDHNDTAASTFHAFVRRPWQEHCAK